jgi:rhodanese-related sulfurtransferase
LGLIRRSDLSDDLFDQIPKIGFGRCRPARDVLSAVVVDARSEAEYAGEDKRAGHIPAACSLEWANLVGEDERFLEESALRAKLTKAGVEPGEPVITHCQGGGRASVNAFVLERLGFKTDADEARHGQRNTMATPRPDPNPLGPAWRVAYRPIELGAGR